MNEGQLWMTIGADNTQFAKAANDTNKRLNDMSNNVKAFTNGIKSSFVEAAKQMAGFYSVAKAGTMFEELIQKNDAFNKSMKEVSTLSDDVAKNLDSYKNQILDMTTKIPIAADDAAKALYQINSAGHTGADGMMVLEASAKAAIGGVTDTATAADTITTVLNAYKMSSSEAAAVSDKLFTAVRLGKTTMSELGASIAQVAPMAATYGISIDQVLAAVATLTKNGTPTAQAFTQIRASIVSMADAMGATYFQTHTLQEGMVALREAVPDNNKLKDVMGRIEGVNAVLAMTGKNAAGAASDLQEFQASAGAAGDAYDKMNSGKGVELTKLQNNIMAEMADLNNEISATIASLAHSINEAFDSGNIDTFVSSLQELIAAYGIYKGVAIAVNAVQAANTAITEAAQSTEMAQLQQVIAMKNAEVGASGQVVISEQAEVTEREAGIIAARTEAKEVLNNLRAKAQEAAMNLENAQAEEAFAASRVAASEQAILMREQELAAAEASGDMLKVEAAENELNAAALEQQDAARALSTAHRNTEAAQIVATNTAKVAETATTMADTAAQTSDAVATSILAKAKLALSTAIDKVTAAMARNPWTAAAVAIAAVAYSVYQLYKNWKENADAQEKQREEIQKTIHAGDELKKNLNSLRSDAIDKCAEDIAKLEGKYHSLQSQWNSLGNDLDKKKKFVIDNKNAFHDLGFEVSNVSDAENFFVKNTDAVVAAMEARAQAAAYQKLMEESYEKQIRANNDLDKKNKYRSAHQGRGSNRHTLTLGDLQDDERAYLEQYYGGAHSSFLVTRDGKAKEGANSGYDSALHLSEDAAKVLDKYNSDKMNRITKQGKDSVNKAATDERAILDRQAKEASKRAQDMLKKSGVQEYNGNGTSTDKVTINSKQTGKTAAQIPAEQNQAHQNLLDLLDKQAIERERKEQDWADNLLAIQIASLKDSAAKRKQQMQLDHDNALKELDREEEDEITHEIENQKAIFDAQEEKNAKGNKKYAKKTFTDANIDQSAIKTIQARYQATREKTFAKQKVEDTALGETELANEREFLKQYGTMQQQRLAIKEEYNKKIADAEEYQKPFLRVEQNKVLTDFDNKTLEEQINKQLASNPLAIKASVNITELSSGDIGALKQQLESARDALSGLPSEKLNEVNNMLNVVDDRLIADNPFQTLKDANKELEIANQDIATYTEELNNANKELADAQQNDDVEQIAKAQNQVTKATNKLTNAQDRQVKADNKVRKSKEQVGNTLSEVGGLINDTAGIVGQFNDETGQFISGIGTLVSSVGAAIKTTSATTTGAIKAIESASAILAIISAAIQLATAAADLLGLTKDDSDYEAAKGQYDALVDVWDTLIERKKEYLSESWGNEIKQTKDEELQLLSNETAAARYTAAQRLASGASAGSHSYGVRMNRDLGDEYFNKIGITTIDDLVDMSADQLKEIQENYSVFWARLDGDFKDALEDIIAYGDEVDDVIEDAKNQLTQTSFDDMYDNFVDTLMDMDVDAATFSDNLSETMMRSLLANQVGTQMKENLRKWYDAYAETLEEGNGKLSQAQIEDFQSQYNSIVDKGIAMRDQLAELTGYDDASSSEASGSINAAQSITEDTANELIGRITAIQLAVENHSTIATTTSELQTNLITQGNAYLSDILNQHALANSYLEDISKYSKATYQELEGQIQKIVDYTSRL